jgi:hypothetical protein
MRCRCVEVPQSSHYGTLLSQLSLSSQPRPRLPSPRSTTHSTSTRPFASAPPTNLLTLLLSDISPTFGSPSAVGSGLQPILAAPLCICTAFPFKASAISERRRLPSTRRCCFSPSHSLIRSAASADAVQQGRSAPVGCAAPRAAACGRLPRGSPASRGLACRGAGQRRCADAGSRAIVLLHFHWGGRRRQQAPRGRE